MGRQQLYKANENYYVERSKTLCVTRFGTAHNIQRSISHSAATTIWLRFLSGITGLEFRTIHSTKSLSRSFVWTTRGTDRLAAVGWDSLSRIVRSLRTMAEFGPRTPIRA